MCGKVYQVRKYRTLTAKYCSISCKAKQKRGARFSRIKTSHNYFLVYSPEHPYANRKGYVYEHRAVLEKKLGRYLNPKHNHIHHIDGNKSNNDVSNLVLLDPKEHMKIHKGWKKIDGNWWKKCNGCGRFLEFKGNFWERTSGKPISPCKRCVIELKRERRRNAREKRNSGT